ncbi:MAG TPA: right-handed parallel beta-helix repeat-containing protein [Verrucomicrobiae bacterium]|nr:right-handed parallel beta-helix repeat-containing protein [Verrucomicrobiae bacterium]
MKISLKQIRSRVIVASTRCAGLLVLVVAYLVCSKALASEPVTITLRAGVTGAEIQRALDALPAEGGAVVLPSGIFTVSQPIVLRRDRETLRGSGTGTVLRLADGANCPVIIMGEPVNNPQRTIRYLCLSSLFIDGNRSHQQRELWQLRGEGSQIRNNGITVQNVSDSMVQHVTSARCRSGGLVTTRGVHRLTVRDFTAFENEFDGLACYHTEDCLFTELYLHNNPGAGISLDLAFNHNVISNAVLAANDLGIFMRASCDNQFYNISIQDSHHYGVFMAHAERQTLRGWQPAPRTECVRNSFTNLIASNCGSAAFRVNDTTCTNNVIVGAQFRDDMQGGLSMVRPDLVIVQ